MTPLTLSVDDLRALARVTGWALPSLLLDDDDLDAAVRDAVAVRGLLARGLVQLTADAVRPTAPLRALLAPLARPHAVAELERDAGEVVLRTAIVEGVVEGDVEAPAGVLVLTEREPDVWRVEPVGGGLAGTVLALLEDCWVGGRLAVARRDGEVFRLEQTEWDAGQDASASCRPLLGAFPGAVA